MRWQCTWWDAASTQRRCARRDTARRVGKHPPGATKYCGTPIRPVARALLHVCIFETGTTFAARTLAIASHRCITFFMLGHAMPVYTMYRGSRRLAFSPGWLKGQCTQSCTNRFAHGRICKEAGSTGGHDVPSGAAPGTQEAQHHHNSETVRFSRIVRAHLHAIHSKLVSGEHGVVVLQGAPLTLQGGTEREDVLQSADGDSWSQLTTVTAFDVFRHGWRPVPDRIATVRRCLARQSSK